MRPKNKYLIIPILTLLVQYSLKGQDVPDYQYYDSVTYNLYLSGNWQKLINLGQDAINKGTDYKYLRQRIGYARFVTGDYYRSATDFKKALSFDSYDQFSLEYLYLSYINTGKEDYSGPIAKRLSPELKKVLDITYIKPVESIEFEYNFKYSGTSHRSNPQYYRLGLGTKLGYRLALLQSFSDYKQVIEIQQPGSNESISTRQLGYYSLLKMLSGSNLIIKAGYHYLYNKSGTSVLNGNMFLLSVAPDLNRFSLEFSGSALKIEQEKIYQTGLQAGYVFQGRSGVYISSGVYGLFQSRGNNTIYTQKGGFRMLKRVWIEGNLTVGRLANYNDYNGLYIYNSFDPITLKSGITCYIPLNRKITLWSNYSWERKEYYENNAFNYNQFSYLGGLRWKL